ncbi:CD302 antigen-like, partial [Carassius auratus]|uniref:CD302 antigen-like n=1 Tax=Carassius auratus TaxID=7957 RepID=A0A6P6KR60_CARAU
RERVTCSARSRERYLRCAENMDSSSRRFSLFDIVFLVLTCHFVQGEDSAECPGDGRMWLPFGLSCYHFVHGEEDIAKSYYLQDAKDMCRGYDLVTVKSAEENDFIIKYTPSVWKSRMSIWLGMYYDSDKDVFRWHDDNSVLSYSNWEDGGSDDTDLVLLDTCVVLHSETGKWENVSCTEEPENGVVCKTKAVWKRPPKGSPLLSALVIISVVLIVLISAVVWFIHQRNDSGSSVLNLMEYHLPFRSPSTDQAGLIQAEEIEAVP